MINLVVGFVAFSALVMGVSVWVGLRSLRGSLREAQRRLYLAQARLNELEGTLRKELQALRAVVRRQTGGTLFDPMMKIGDAVAIDPRVRHVLAQFHLGGCSACAVNEEQTFQEVTTQYGVNLEHLLAALESLADGPPSPPQAPTQATLLRLEEF